MGQNVTNRSDGEFTLVTEGVRVSVVPVYLPDVSEPDRSIFTFAYSVVIKNVGNDPVQLLQRHWIIKSGGDVTGEVMGPGVVGVQPTLSPGESFHYTSNSVIQDPVGTMEGTYTFSSESGRLFVVAIPRFNLIVADMVQ